MRLSVVWGFGDRPSRTNRDFYTIPVNQPLSRRIFHRRARWSAHAARSLTIDQPVSLEGARSGGTARPTKYISLAESGAVLDPYIICKDLRDCPTGDAAPPRSGRGGRRSRDFTSRAQRQSLELIDSQGGA